MPLGFVVEEAPLALVLGEMPLALDAEGVPAGLVEEGPVLDISSRNLCNKEKVVR